MISKRTRLAAFTLSAAGAVAGLTASSEAHAYARFCKWPVAASGLTTVPVDVNRTEFDNYGYDGDEVLTATSNAFHVWNQMGGSVLRFQMGGFTTNTTATGGRVLITGKQIFGPDPGRAAGTYYACGTGYIEVYLNWYYEFALPTSAGGADYWGVALHELGHTIGLDHSGASHAVMQAWVSSVGERRFLFPDDIMGLRNDATYGYAAAGGGVVRQRYSTNKGTSFYPLTDVGGAANLTPAMTYGSAGYVVGRVEPGTNRITYAKGNGTSWAQTFTTQTTHTGLALAYGAGKYVAAVVNADDAKAIHLYTSTDAVTWTDAGLVSAADARTQVKPALTWSAFHNRFILAYSFADTFEIRFATSANGTSWTAWDGGDTAEWGSRFSAQGPAIACTPAADRCTLVIPEGRRVGSYFREYLVHLDGAFKVKKLDDGHGLPPQATRHFATFAQGIGAAWDAANSQFALGFAERNTLKSLNAWWRADGTSTPHPSYSAGGAPFDNLVTGVDVAYGAPWVETAFSFVAP